MKKKRHWDEFELPRLEETGEDEDEYTLIWPEVDHGLLPEEIAEQIQRARFTLNRQYFAAAEYCRMMAKREYDNPLLLDFDTIIRDSMNQTCAAYVRMFFCLLGDCIVPHVENASDPMYWWANYAGYLFWVKRTGAALYRGLAGMESGGFKKYQTEIYAKLDWTINLESKRKK